MTRLNDMGMIVRFESWINSAFMSYKSIAIWWDEYIKYSGIIPPFRQNCSSYMLVANNGSRRN